MSIKSYQTVFDRIQNLPNEEFRGRDGMTRLKDLLEASYETKGHPNASRLFSLAWEYGHSAGVQEVLIYYDDMVDLIQ